VPETKGEPGFDAFIFARSASPAAWPLAAALQGAVALGVLGMRLAVRAPVLGMPLAPGLLRGPLIGSIVGIGSSPRRLPAAASLALTG
jgi:hypothetical protein